MGCYYDDNGDYVCEDTSVAGWVIGIIVAAVIGKIIFWVCVCYWCCYRPRYVVPIRTSNVTVVSASTHAGGASHAHPVYPAPGTGRPITAYPVEFPAGGTMPPTAQPLNPGCNTVVPPPYNPHDKAKPTLASQADYEDEDDGSNATDQSALLGP